jgi:deoxyribonuclease V
MQMPNFRWDVAPDEAVRIQMELAQRVVPRDEAGEIRHIAGVDVGFEGEDNQTARAAVVVLAFPSLDVVDVAVGTLPVTFPYIPGLLSFREIPVILNAMQRLKTEPDMIIVDGQGQAHPRRLGIASHLGLVLDRPTIGCAKSRLTGHVVEPENRVGAWTSLTLRGEVIGATLRMRVNTKPVFVSIGHRVSLGRAIELVLACGRGFRLPETTRWAHRAADGQVIPLVRGQGGH